MKEKASEKGDVLEEGEEKFEGSINTKKGTAKFPATMDTLGKIVVPMYVRNRLGLKGKTVEMQVAIEVREGQE